MPLTVTGDTTFAEIHDGLRPGLLNPGWLSKEQPLCGEVTQGGVVLWAREEDFMYGLFTKVREVDKTAVDVVKDAMIRDHGQVLTNLVFAKVKSAVKPERMTLIRDIVGGFKWSIDGKDWVKRIDDVVLRWIISRRDLDRLHEELRRHPEGDRFHDDL